MSEGSIEGQKVLLLKPTTYMNLSGESVSKVVNFYKVDPKKDILILVDDLDMEFAKVRYRTK
jgi:PTH1 family peptidyl-tRNA hydrolase